MILGTPDCKTFHTLYALDSFRAYWLENERLINKEADAEETRNWPKWTPKTPEEYAEFNMERRDARHLHDEIMIPTFRYSCVVMLYAIVERELLRLVRNLEEERGASNPVFACGKGSVLKPVTKFCEDRFDLRLQACPEYGALCDLQNIRDCIVHCRGEVALFDAKRRPDLVSLNDRRDGFFAHERMEIEIRPPCIDQFTRETWRFFSWAFRELKWEIDASWKEDGWG